MPLNNKKIVVIGGSSGIGYATAEMAKAQGAEVIIAARAGEKLDKAAQALGARAIAADISQDAPVEALFKALGPVDHVVVSAASATSAPFKSIRMEDARAGIEAKFWGTWRVASFAEINAGGSLTIVTGGLAVRPRLGSMILVSANGALESLTKGLALELAPVRVNAVSPGVIDTPLRSKMTPEARKTLLDKAAAGLPLKRVGLAKDVAIQILAFIHNDFTTGSIARVDGGGSIA